MRRSRITHHLLLLILVGWAADLRAVEPDKTPKPAATPAPKAEPPVKRTEKKIRFEMRGKPWDQVFEWLTKETGVPVFSDIKLEKKLDFYAAPDKTYSIPEVIDVINDALLLQQCILVRRNTSFVVLRVNQKMDPHFLPLVPLDELDQHGKTEIVQIVLTLDSVAAEDIAEELKKLLGPYGEVISMKGNHLALQATVGSLERVKKTIAIIQNQGKSPENYSHQCQFIKASDAEKKLRDILGVAQQNKPQTPNFGFPFGRFVMPGMRGANEPAKPETKSKTPLVIASDERTNIVFVTGPVDKVSQAREIIEKQIDVAQGKADKPVLTGAPFIQSYSVPAGNAEAVAKSLQEIYKESNSIRISSAGTNSLVVYAGPQEQFDIATHLASSTAKDTKKIEVFNLNNKSASDIAFTLKGIYRDRKDAPYFDYDSASNTLTATASAEQMKEIRELVKVLGATEGQAATGNMRVISLNQGNAAVLAETLEKLLPQLRKNPVKVVAPNTGGDKAPKEPTKKPQNGDKNQSHGNNEESESSLSQDGSLLFASSTTQKPAESDKPGSKDAPITLTVIGNRLIITSEDPQALAMVDELVRLLTQTPSGEGGFEVLKLKHTSAMDAADLLDQLYNGPKTQSQATPSAASQPPMGGASRIGQAATPAATPSRGKERIRVVADPATNSLLIRATQLDLIEIRQLLEKNIDLVDANSPARSQPWIIALKSANATEVASVLRDVFRPKISPVARGNVSVGVNNPANIYGGGQFVAPNGNQNAMLTTQTPALTVGVDERSNSIVVNCSKPLYEDIRKLVDQLELAAKDTTRTVKVVPIKGMSPQLVQQALDAIQGRVSTPRAQNNNNFNNGINNITTPNANFPQFIPFPSNPGGANPVTPGSGQPRGPRPIRGGQSQGGQSRGPDFFADRVKDDPEATLLYDPQLAASNDSDGEEQELSSADGDKAPVPAEESGFQAPRLPVTVEALDQLGVIVISGKNPQDVAEILKIIEYIQKVGAGSEVKFHLVPLTHADATSVANTLTQLFQRVIVGPGGNVLGGGGAIGAPRIQQGQPSGFVQANTFVQPNQSNQASNQTGTVILLPLPRFNAILMAAPAARAADIILEIKKLDQPSSPRGWAMPIPLKKASATRVATLIQQFYAQRYPNETTGQHQIRVTHDDSTNTIFVQAAPSDFEEIKILVARIDSNESSAVNELRIVRLKNALAEELALTLQQSISQGVVAPSASGGIGGVGGVGGQGGVQAQPFVQPGQAGNLGRTAATKTSSLRFISKHLPKSVETGFLEDIYITPDYRTNSLVLSAPAKTIDLLLALINDLDVIPAARAEIKVFTLRKADALIMSTMLQQLLQGNGSAGGSGGAPGIGGAFPGAAGGPRPPALGGAGAGGGNSANQRPLFTLGGAPSEAAPLVNLQISVDQRTNSVIVAGNPYEVDVIEAIISRLEDTDIEGRHHEVYRLKNTTAADIALALQNFIKASLGVLNTGQQLTPFQEILQDVVVIPEPISNTLLLSASPRNYPEVVRLIQQLDALQPEVVIQVLIADIDLTGDLELGVQFGLQSPVLFQRSILPGLTVNSTTNPAAAPGFDFNTTAPLGNNPFVSPNLIGVQGLTNLGVGRSAAGSTIGGFILSASSDSFSVLIRALQTQNRVDVLSRPQIMTMNNQTSTVQVGQSFPYVTASVISTGVTGIPAVTNTVNYRDTGVLLKVTPKINPDGTIVMRVTPQVIAPTMSNVNLGNGVLATAFDVQSVDTTVVAQDGETVAIGGLISKRNTFAENKYPWLGDLPYVGGLFRYRVRTYQKRELLVIMTPHIVNSPQEADRVLAEESRRLDWALGDVLKLHATTGMEPITHPCPPPVGPPVGIPVDPVMQAPLPGKTTPAQPLEQILTPPRPLPPSNEAQSQGPALDPNRNMPASAATAQMPSANPMVPGKALLPSPAPRPLKTRFPPPGTPPNNFDAPTTSDQCLPPAVPVPANSGVRPPGPPPNNFDLPPAGTGATLPPADPATVEPSKEKSRWSAFRRNF